MAGIGIVFIYADGCPACEAAKPELSKFQVAHPNVAVQRIDLLQAKWPDQSWAPKATPTYLAVVDGKRPVGFEGFMRKEEIEQFLRIAAPKLGVGSPV